jgi:hypothetical protein
VRGWLWADGAWTARGGGDGGTVLVPARGFELWFYSVGWGTIRGQGRTQAQNFDERQSFFLQKGSRDWLSPLDRHQTALISGLHGCTGTWIALDTLPFLLMS